MAIVKAPKRFSKNEMEKAGVLIIDAQRLQCARCSSVWRPNLLPGGRHPRGYWKCPNGCNYS